MLSELNEQNYINNIINNYCEILKEYSMQGEQFCVLCALLYTLRDYDEDNRIFDDQNTFITFMSLPLSGFVKLNKMVIGFEKFVEKEKDSLIRNSFFLSITLLIILAYFDCNNIYKASIQIRNNAKYILQYIKNYLQNKSNNSKIIFDYFYLDYLKRKIPILISIIYSSDLILK